MSRSKEPAGKAKSPNGDEDDDLQTLQPVTQLQDPAERRLIRHQYRQLLQGTQENQDALVRPDSNQLHETLTEANNLFQNVKMTREAAMDSQLIAVLSKLSRKQAQSLQADLVSFEPVEFTGKLISFLQRQPLAPSHDSHTILKEDWRRIGEVTQSFFKRTPPLHFMFGSFEHDKEPRPPKVDRSKRAKDCEKDKSNRPTAPKQLKSFKESEQTEVTTEQVQHILNALRTQYRLRKKQPICYFAFVINPHSFGKTVENIFYTSFLIKDGVAKISLDKDKLPVISPVSETGRQQEHSTENHHQVVMALTKQDWREIVSTFNINKCLITPAQFTRNGSHNNGDELMHSESDEDD